jgi:uroporphyrinogen-III synthase
MRLLITRPRRDAEAVARVLHDRGIDSLMEPLLKVTNLTVPNFSLDDVQAVLLTSANGARALAQASTRRDVAVLAVGAATAAAARDAGFTDVEAAGGDVEALGGLAKARLDPHGRPLIHVSGSAVAGDLAGYLSEAEFTVRRTVLYEATPVSALSPTAVAGLNDGAIDGVLLFSPRTAKSFVRLARESSVRLTQVRALCLSRAVADQAAAAPWRSIEVAARPDQEALLDLIGD